MNMNKIADTLKSFFSVRLWPLGFDYESARKQLRAARSVADAKRIIKGLLVIDPKLAPFYKPKGDNRVDSNFVATLVRIFYPEQLEGNVSKNILERIYAAGYMPRSDQRLLVLPDVVNSPIPSIAYAPRQLNYGRTRKPKDIVQIILHHDVSNSPEGTFNTFLRHGTSSHGIFTWNGVFIQFLPFIQTGYHALGHVRYGKQASRKKVQPTSFNHYSIGLDINNPVIPDQASGIHKYTHDRIQIKRGKQLVTYLEPTEDQIYATSQLIEKLCYVFSIPKVTSYAGYAWDGGRIKPTTPGVFAHHHVSLNRWVDPVGFEYMVKGFKDLT